MSVMQDYKKRPEVAKEKTPYVGILITAALWSVVVIWGFYEATGGLPL